MGALYMSSKVGALHDSCVRACIQASYQYTQSPGHVFFSSRHPTNLQVDLTDPDMLTYVRIGFAFAKSFEILCMLVVKIRITAKRAQGDEAYKAAKWFKGALRLCLVCLYVCESYLSVNSEAPSFMDPTAEKYRQSTLEEFEQERLDEVILTHVHKDLRR